MDESRKKLDLDIAAGLGKELSAQARQLFDKIVETHILPSLTKGIGCENHKVNHYLFVNYVPFMRLPISVYDRGVG